MKRVKFLFVQIFLASALLSPIALNWAFDGDDEHLPLVHIINTEDIRLDADLADKMKAPILLLFSTVGCDYCLYVEEEHLKPMLRNPEEYGDKVVIRRLVTDTTRELIDFDGSTISMLDFANRYKASFTPTVVFLDHTGKQLSRIIGVRNMDFYGGDLDESLQVSLNIIRHRALSMR